MIDLYNVSSLARFLCIVGSAYGFLYNFLTLYYVSFASVYIRFYGMEFFIRLNIGLMFMMTCALHAIVPNDFVIWHWAYILFWSIMGFIFCNRLSGIILISSMVAQLYHDIKGRKNDKSSTE